MYKFDTCEYCGEQFAKNDDIVVCPDCGSPYHRKCWQEHGACAHEAEHAAGFVYGAQSAAPQVPAAEEDFVGQIRRQIAQGAQHEQAHPGEKRQYCENCGAKLIEGDEYCVYCAHRQGDPVRSNNNRRFAQQDPLGGLAPEEEIGGQKAADVALVVRNNSAKWMPRLKATDQAKVKIGWSWPAFLFGYLYFFFRKMYKYGLIIILAQVLLFNVLNFALGDPVLKTNQVLAAQYNTVVKTEAPTREDYYKVVEATALEMNESGVTRQLYILLAANVISVHLICALLFNTLYLRHCTNTIERMKRSEEILGGMSKSEYRLNLLARGGISIFGIFIGYFAKMAVEEVVSFLISFFGA